MCNGTIRVVQKENDVFVFLICTFYMCVYVCVQSKQLAVTDVPVAVSLDQRLNTGTKKPMIWNRQANKDKVRERWASTNKNRGREKERTGRTFSKWGQKLGHHCISIASLTNNREKFCSKLHLLFLWCFRGVGVNVS